jgi:type VI secretion system protein ImpB
MAKRGSVAPKERINIIYRPATSPGEKVELPLKMLVMADLTGRPDDRSLEERKPINVDKDNFHEVMRNQELGVDVNVKDRLQDEKGHELGVNLKFGGLRDFTPGGIAQQVPELKKLLELRDALSSLKSPIGNKKGFRKRIQEIMNDPEARAKMLQELGMDEDGGGGN